MKNCIVAQSGGPTAAINASLSGVIAGVMNSQEFDTIYGSVNGITGILEQRIVNLSTLFASGKPMLDKLIQTPAMYLGSCRYKMPAANEDPEVYKAIFRFFEEHEIYAFFYIGGNDSMDTVDKLSAYAASIESPVRIIGVPKTIDNDLCLTDHTPGFGSAAKYVASTLLEIAHDAYIYRADSVTIVEVMGRDSGWLTAASVLARTHYSAAPHLIYLPECAFSPEEFLADVKQLLTKQHHVIVAVSEGIRNKDGQYISASSNTVDNFGHSQLSGVGKTLEYYVKEQLGVKVRSIELNVLQRCASHLASKTDLDEAFRLGQHAATCALSGQTAVMLTYQRTSNAPYTITYGTAPVCDIANKAKDVPRSFINERGNDVTVDMIDYLTPLIQGEASIQYENGVPAYLPVDHLLS